MLCYQRQAVCCAHHLWPLRCRYSLRFSGHSLGAGTAALATFLLRTQPGRYPTLLAAFPRSEVDCFCASAPPVLSHSLARATADYITTLTLGHDVVARASVANLEGLRLEILRSGWWEDMEDQVRKSQIVQNVKAVLEHLGAHSLVDLARSSARALAASDRPRPKPNAGTPEMTANGPPDRLHEGDACTGSGVQPTVRRAVCCVLHAVCCVMSAAHLAPVPCCCNAPCTGQPECALLQQYRRSRLRARLVQVPI